MAAFVFYPSFYTEFFPQDVSGPLLQARSSLVSMATDIENFLGDTGSRSPTVNSTWAGQFFSQLNVDRGEAGALSPCPSLSSFAEYRFDDMTTGTNYEISHYNYQTDLQTYFQGQAGSYEEEYFFPDGYTPSAYLGIIQQQAPEHWAGLMNSSYASVGYYIGQGPVITYSQNLGSTCNAPTEVVGEGVNMTQIASGCKITVVQGAWFVIELSSVCPAGESSA